MIRAGGYGCISYDDGRRVEHDTFSCRHCNRVTIVRAKQRPEDIGGLCKVCMGLTCPQCTGGNCTPLIRRVEEAEARYHALRSYGVV
jgi:hypothetical protein